MRPFQNQQFNPWVQTSFLSKEEASKNWVLWLFDLKDLNQFDANVKDLTQRFCLFDKGWNDKTLLETLWGTLVKNDVLQKETTILDKQIRWKQYFSLMHRSLEVIEKDHPEKRLSALHECRRFFSFIEPEWSPISWDDLMQHASSLEGLWNQEKGHPQGWLSDFFLLSIKNETKEKLGSKSVFEDWLLKQWVHSIDEKQDIVLQSKTWIQNKFPQDPVAQNIFINQALKKWFSNFLKTLNHSVIKEKLVLNTIPHATPFPWIKERLTIPSFDLTILNQWSHFTKEPQPVSLMLLAIQNPDCTPWILSHAMPKMDIQTFKKVIQGPLNYFLETAQISWDEIQDENSNLSQAFQVPHQERSRLVSLWKDVLGVSLDWTNHPVIKQTLEKEKSKIHKKLNPQHLAEVITNWKKDPQSFKKILHQIQTLSESQQQWMKSHNHRDQKVLKLKESVSCFLPLIFHFNEHCWTFKETGLKGHDQWMINFKEVLKHAASQGEFFHHGLHQLEGILKENKNNLHHISWIDPIMAYSEALEMERHIQLNTPPSQCDKESLQEAPQKIKLRL